MFEIIDDKSNFVKMGQASNIDNLNIIEKEITNMLKDLALKEEMS